MVVRDVQKPVTSWEGTPKGREASSQALKQLLRNFELARGLILQLLHAARFFLDRWGFLNTGGLHDGAADIMMLI